MEMLGLMFTTATKVVTGVVQMVTLQQQVLWGKAALWRVVIRAGKASSLNNTYTHIANLLVRLEQVTPGLVSAVVSVCRYGCCPDGISTSRGPNKEGCAQYYSDVYVNRNEPAAASPTVCVGNISARCS